MTTEPDPQRTDLMRPAEVASLFGVSPKTVTRWAEDGKLPSVRTRGGHRRFDEDEVLRILKET